MAQMRVSKENGQLLFDTSLICYGLVKSGYMTYQQTWTRRSLRSAQLDPNDGASWTPSAVTAATNLGDSLYGFTLDNALSPIVFIVGTGCLAGSSRSGSSLTFFYANADANTRFYCFDLMQDNIPGSPYMKTWTNSGVITFNSLQPPLNVVANIQAPTPGATDVYGRYQTTYVGGYNVHRQTSGGPNQDVTKVDSRVDIALAPGVEYAAYLPWSRSCGIADMYPGNVFPFTMYSGSEGAYGRVGGISFMFGAAAGTTQSYPSNVGWQSSFYNLPTDRYPIALVVQTAGLPFPYR